MRFLKILVLFLSVIGATCQTKTFVGLKAGGGASTAYMQHSIVPVVMDVSWRPGFTGGLQLTHFPEKFKSKLNAGIQIGINYTQKGWIQKFKDSNEPAHKTRINYLEVPLEAVGYFGNKNKYYLSLGFFLEYALRANVDETPESAVQRSDYPSLKRVGESDFYRYRLRRDHKLGYGPRGGVGVFRETSIGVFRIEGYFTFSVRSTFDFEPLESGIPDLSLQYGAGVTIGYMFSFGQLDL